MKVIEKQRRMLTLQQSMVYISSIIIHINDSTFKANGKIRNLLLLSILVKRMLKVEEKFCFYTQTHIQTRKKSSDSHTCAHTFALACFLCKKKKLFIKYLFTNVYIRNTHRLDTSAKNRKVNEKKKIDATR